jgi:crotonobetainyl-CoA:carnitine CoA-transferase CaiB-like acyl-CoA transferase
MARRPRGADPARLASYRQNAPYQRMQTKDGYLMVGAAGEAIWARCAEALGHPEWCEDPRFATNQARMANHDALEDVMNAVLTTKTTSDWVEVLEAAGAPCGHDGSTMAKRRPAAAKPYLVGIGRKFTRSGGWSARSRSGRCAICRCRPF